MTKWPNNPMLGPTGLFKIFLKSPQSIAQPKLTYSMLTSVATLAVNMVSIKRFFLITITFRGSSDNSAEFFFLQDITVLPKRKQTRIMNNISVFYIRKKFKKRQQKQKKKNKKRKRKKKGIEKQKNQKKKNKKNNNKIYIKTRYYS